MRSSRVRKSVSGVALAGMLCVSVVAHVAHPQFHESERHCCSVHAAGSDGEVCGRRPGEGGGVQTRTVVCARPAAHDATRVPSPTRMGRECPICSFIAHVKLKQAPLPSWEQADLQPARRFVISLEHVVRIDPCLSLLGPRAPPAVA